MSMVCHSKIMLVAVVMMKTNFDDDCKDGDRVKVIIAMIACGLGIDLT